MKDRIAAAVRDTLYEELREDITDALDSEDTEEALEQLRDILEDKISERLEKTVREIIEPEQTQFTDVVDFVTNFLTRMYPYTSVREKEIRWTKYWWNHEEAVARLSALWLRYEQLRKAEPSTYVETFLRVHGDYHMGVLMKPGGVFDDSRREDLKSIPLPTAPIPNQKAGK